MLKLTIKRKALLMSAIFGTALLISASTSAAECIPRGTPIPEPTKCTSILPEAWCTDATNGVPEVINLILDILTLGTGVNATIGIVITGIQWLTARDKEDQVVKAKSRIFNIIIGLSIWGLMWLVLSWLLPGGIITSIDLPATTIAEEKEIIWCEEPDPSDPSIPPGTTPPDIDPSFKGYNQFSEPWASMPYGDCSGATYASAGCGPSAVASIVTAMTGRQVTPDQIGTKAVSRGYRPCGNGSSHNISSIVEDYGLEVRGDVPRSDIEAMSSHLRNGAMLLVTIRKNTALNYGGSGHFIVIRGITSTGKWLVYDSAGNQGQQNATKEFTPSSLTSSFKYDPHVIYK